MAPARIVIAGAGFGGLALATELRRVLSADEAEVDLVDRDLRFRMGLRKLWLLDGRSSLTDGVVERARATTGIVTFRHADIERIDADSRTVVTAEGDLRADFLVVALGAVTAPHDIPGDSSGAYDVYDAASAAAAGNRLRDFDAGRIVIAIAGLPYRCPPAPFEAALLADDLMRTRAVRDGVQIDVFTPAPRSVPAAGPAASEWIEQQLAHRGISFHPSAHIEAIEGSSLLLGGDRVDADLLLFVPPHRPPAVVSASTLASDSGWIAVEPATLETSFRRVWGIGDSVSLTTGAGLPFPKAGVFAESHAKVVASSIVGTIREDPTAERFSGDGFCFLEVGGGEASAIEGNFSTAPPTLEIEPPSRHGLERKFAFEQDRLSRWFAA